MTDQTTEAVQPLPPETRDLRELLSTSTFDHLDIGSSKGGSIEYARRHLGAVSSIGMDIDAAKVARSRKEGWNVVEADVLDPSLPHDCVDFSTCFHVLEHLPTVEIAQEIIAASIRLSRNYVMMRHPYFDLDGLLAQQGLKLYYSDWSGHTCQLDTLTHFKIYRKLPKDKIHGYWIFGRGPVDLRAGEGLVPLSAKINTLGTEAEASRRTRPDLSLPAAYKELCLLIDLRETREEGSQAWLDDILLRSRIRPQDLLVAFHELEADD